jgi:tetratricopeptide (TPR) repeat protein
MPQAKSSASFGAAPRGMPLPASAPADAAASAPRSGGASRWAIGAAAILAVAVVAWLLSRVLAPGGIAPIAVAAPGTAASASDPALDRQRRADAEIAAGDRLMTAGDAAQAAAAYERALGIEPTRLEAALKLGRARESQNDYDGAERAYAQAMQIAPNSAAPWLERGASRAEQGRFADAVADYTKAIGLQGDDPIAYFNRGAANEGQKRVAAAVADYTSALGLRPDFVPALLARARLLESTRPATAIADYESVLALPASAADQQLARDRLKVLGNAATTRAAPQIAIQYHDSADQPRVDELRNALAAALKPAAVATPELRATNASDIRYYFAEDEPFARQVLGATELQLARQGVRSELKLRRLDPKEFPRVRAGTVEIWLPSLAATQPVPRPTFVQRTAPTDAAPAPSVDPAPQLYRKQ